MSSHQTCKACGHRDKFDFHLPDDIWAAVVPAQFRSRVVCLSCFDGFAHEADIDYADCLKTLYFAGDQVVFKFRAVSATAARDFSGSCRPAVSPNTRRKARRLSVS